GTVLARRVLPDGARRLLCCAKFFDSYPNARYPSPYMSRREREPVAVTSFDQHAEESLQFIRRTMERTSTFTAVPGVGGVGMGAIGLAATVLAANQSSAERWLIVWLLAAAVALSIGV